eukprot:m.166827 g.166827  ORF g.166827 m.166827 type:complete len:1046 (-) comp16441_c0_seq3:451-3588(-)
MPLLELPRWPGSSSQVTSENEPASRMVTLRAANSSKTHTLPEAACSESGRLVRLLKQATWTNNYTEISLRIPGEVLEYVVGLLAHMHENNQEWQSRCKPNSNLFLLVFGAHALELSVKDEIKNMARMLVLNAYSQGEEGLRKAFGILASHEKTRWTRIPSEETNELDDFDTIDDMQSELFSWGNAEVRDFNDAVIEKHKNAPACSRCEKDFNALRRRHHCRLCFKAFCHSCSPFRRTLRSEYVDAVNQRLDVNSVNRVYNHLVFGIDADKGRVCSECHVTYLHAEQGDLGLYPCFVEAFEICKFELPHLLLLTRITPAWAVAAFDIVHTFRRMMTYMPTHVFGPEEHELLWLNREYLRGHHRWLTLLVKSTDWYDCSEAKIEALEEVLGIAKGSKPQSQVRMTCGELGCLLHEGNAACQLESHAFESTFKANVSLDCFDVFEILVSPQPIRHPKIRKHLVFILSGLAAPLRESLLPMLLQALKDEKHAPSSPLWKLLLSWITDERYRMKMYWGLIVLTRDQTFYRTATLLQGAFASTVTERFGVAAFQRLQSSNDFVIALQENIRDTASLQEALQTVLRQSIPLPVNMDVAVQEVDIAGIKAFNGCNGMTFVPLRGVCSMNSETAANIQASQQSESRRFSQCSYLSEGRSRSSSIATTSSFTPDTPTSKTGVSFSTENKIDPASPSSPFITSPFQQEPIAVIAPTESAVSLTTSSVTSVTSGLELRTDELMLKEAPNSFVDNDDKGDMSDDDAEDGEVTPTPSSVKFLSSSTSSVFEEPPPRNDAQLPCTVGLGYKTDDVRLDQVAVCIIKVASFLLPADVRRALVIYDVVPTCVNEGLVEWVSNARSITDIRSAGHISSFLLRQHNPEVMPNFTYSLAVYSVLTFLLGVGDRHTDNMLVTNRGQFFHIDYGFLGGKDPKPFLNIVFGLHPDMLKGVDVDEFYALCSSIFQRLRLYAHVIVSMLAILHKMSPAVPPSRICDPNDLDQALAWRYMLTRDNQSAATAFNKALHGESDSPMQFTVLSWQRSLADQLKGIWRYMVPDTS